MTDNGFFSELLNLSAKSKTVAFAVCACSACLIFLPRVTDMSSLPSPWLYIARAAFFFSAALLVPWIFEQILLGVTLLGALVYYSIYLRYLSAQERRFLELLGSSRNYSYWVNQFQGPPENLSLLEYGIFVDGLENKGLVKRLSGDTIVGLTNLGKKRAFKLMQRTQKKLS